MALRQINTPQVGRFEYGLAYSDWRSEQDSATSEVARNPFLLSLSSPVRTDRGLQVMLPYRAQSFTQGQSLVTPAGTIVNGALAETKSTVGLKAFLLEDAMGTAEESQNGLILPGPMAGDFTASGFYENGFNVGPEAPFLIDEYVSGAGVALKARGKYQVVVVYEMTDENGQRLWSLPSPPLNYTLTGNFNAATYGGRLPVPLDEDGNLITDHVGPTNRLILAINIYRTSYQDNVPTTVHYKITQELNRNGLAPITTLNASGFAFPDEFTWTYKDENPDVNILSSEQLYTDKGKLPRFPAPANRGGCTWKNREWLIGYDGAVWMSGERTEGDAAWFFPAFRFRFGNDRAVSCAGMDDFLIVQCESSVWYIPAPAAFPDATGRNGALPTPIQLPFSNGGTGFAKTLRIGVAYSSTAGGVWLITRDLRNLWLSQPAQDALENLTVTGMCVDADQRLHVATGTSGWFVYDQVVDCWYEWRLSTTSATLAAAINGQAAWQDISRVAQYTPGTFSDLIGEVEYPTPPEIELASLQFVNVRGLKRVWEFQIVGKYKGPHRLNVTCSYPDEENAPPTVYDPFVPTPGAPYVYPFNPNPEEAGSFGVKMTVDFQGVVAPGDSAEFELISAEAGVDSRVGISKTTRRIVKR